jgi:SAM-dependent methyltransferase
MIDHLKGIIRGARLQLEHDLAGSPRKWYFSPATYSQYRVTLPLIRQFARGRLIDLGCGDMPFRALVIDQVSLYESLDLWPRSPTVTYVGDIQNMLMIADAMYDTALCIEVLEHVPNPCAAAREIYRILKPGGRLILSVPHLSRLHDEPYDFYRYTHYGLEHLLHQAGLEVMTIQKRGGLFSFFGHQIATIIVGLAWNVPVLKEIVWTANSWFITRLCVWLDSRLDTSGLFALGYSVVASKAASDVLA